MTRFKVILISALGAMAIPLFAASGAQADYYSCVFTGATGSIAANNDDLDGVESIESDLAGGDKGDALPGDVTGLTDTDNGRGGPESWLDPQFGATDESENPLNDGTYAFDTSESPLDDNPSSCLFVDTTPFPERSDSDYTADIFPINIESAGEYENVVCGTGIAISDPADEETQVTANGDGLLGSDKDDFDPVVQADYLIRFSGGQGALEIRNATNESDEEGIGGGYVNIVPDVSEPGSGDCIEEDVSRFLASGAFVAQSDLGEDGP